MGDDLNGTAVNAEVGQRVVIVLDTTAWTFAPVSNPAVAQQSESSVQPGPPGCQSLASCGSVSVTVIGRMPGHVVVNAIREKCGELVRCTGSEGSFSITLDIRP